MADKYVKTSSIEKFDVAAYNADPFCIEDDEMMENVRKDLGYWSEKYELGDEDFVELAEMLDGDKDTFKTIYFSNGVIFGVLK